MSEYLKQVIADLESERDAALRERDEARGECTAWQKCAENAEARAKKAERKLSEVRAALYTRLQGEIDHHEHRLSDALDLWDRLEAGDES